MSAYKNTLNLPKTDFPMKASLISREPAILAKWEADGLYHKIQELRKDAPVFVLHDGPPFANGDVHMGTALNKILKDFVVKSRSMLGYRAPFVPGWDCHGLPIEFKVVKESAGLSPTEVRKRSEAYARKFIDIQKRQFRRLGVLGDWEDPYLTFAPEYEAKVIRSFARFVEEGLVYRSKKPVLWSTGAQTALAEAEVEYKNKTSPSIYVRFAVESGEFAGKASIIIWTTTPWTLPANLAIAVHPSHRYVVAELGGRETVIVADALLDAFVQVVHGGPVRVIKTLTGAELQGMLARHPFLDRHASVYTAEFVTLDTGTGCVHIAPGHGEDDYVLGVEHGLELLSPVDDHGRYTGECGVPELVGKYVFDANEDVLRLLERRGALVAREAFEHSYPHCWRSKTPVIFRAVEQFFIRIDGLRSRALAEIEKVEWLPHWGRNRIRGTVESRPDWCISRQRTWGVPLPVFYTRETGEPILDPRLIRKVADVVSERGTNAWFELDDAQWCELIGLPRGSTRRNDTLDVWIDSGVSHEAVLRTRPDLQFPADLYLEATDQHRGWFQSSLMTSVAMNAGAPYKQVLTHGFVVDVDTRAKISKSAQGAYHKPTEADHYVNKYGADVVRLWVSSVNFTDDVPFSEEIFTRLSDAYRRIRNTLRILLGNLDDYDPDAPAVAAPIDEWILARLQEVIATCRDAYEKLEFHRVFHSINQFCAVDLSAMYVDITKDRLYCAARDSRSRRATQAAMRRIFEALVKLLAPILSFTAEEAWGYFAPGTSVHTQLLPHQDLRLRNEAVLADVSKLFALRSRIAQGVEAAQKRGEIANTLEARVQIDIADPAWRADLASRIDELEEFFILSHLAVGDGSEDAVTVTKTERAKCERCWRHRPDIGVNADHPSLCGRCAAAVITHASRLQPV